VFDVTKGERKMAHPIVANNILAARIWVQDVEQASVTTHHYRVVSTVGNPSLESFADAVDAAVAADYKGLLYNGAEYRGVQAYLMSTLPPPSPAVSVTNAGIGTGGAVGLPRQTAGIISWLTQYRGARYRGRTYVPFPPTGGDEDQGKPNAAYVAAMGSLATDLYNLTTVGSGGNTADVELGIWSEKFSSFEPITGNLLRSEWGTIKKRGSYGRPNNSPI
jgi:hypothetical protein